jgi:SAM-dependent methyltransferase
LGTDSPRLYGDLANWWPLMSPPSHYVEEAADLLPLLLDDAESPAGTLLELGAGGGSLASHLKAHFRLTLTDRSPHMLAVSQIVNPECEHIVGDMMSLDLGREFDRVLIHDAIMYAVEPDHVRAALRTYAFILRDADGSTRVEIDRHRVGCFARANWLRWFEEAGLRTRIHVDPWRTDVFVGVKV